MSAAAIRILREELIWLKDAKMKLQVDLYNVRVPQDLVRRQLRQLDAEFDEIEDALLVLGAPQEEFDPYYPEAQASLFPAEVLRQAEPEIVVQ